MKINVQNTDFELVEPFVIASTSSKVKHQIAENKTPEE